MDRQGGYYLDRDTALWVYGGFIVLSILMTSIRNIIFYKICMNSSKNLHNHMFSCLLKAPMLFFDTHPSGKYLTNTIYIFPLFTVIIRLRIFIHL